MYCFFRVYSNQKGIENFTNVNFSFLSHHIVYVTDAPAYESDFVSSPSTLKIVENSTIHIPCQLKDMGMSSLRKRVKWRQTLPLICRVHYCRKHKNIVVPQRGANCGHIENFHGHTQQCTNRTQSLAESDTNQS